MGAVDKNKGINQSYQPLIEEPKTDGPEKTKKRSGFFKGFRLKVLTGTKSFFNFIFPWPRIFSSGAKDVQLHEMKGLFSGKFRVPEPGTEKVHLNFSSRTFDMSTLWKKKPLKGADKLSSLLEKAEKWKYTNDLEKILPVYFKLESQLKYVESQAAKEESQLFRYLDNGKIELIDKQDAQSADEGVYNLREERLGACEILASMMKSFLEEIGPDKEIAKLESLEEELKRARAKTKVKVNEDRFKEKKGKLLKSIANKRARYQKIMYHKASPNTRHYARKWLKETEGIDERFQN